MLIRRARQVVAGAAPAPARSFPAPRLSRLSLFGSRRRLSREPAGTSAREDARCSSVGPGGPRMVPARPPEWLSGLELESRVSAAVSRPPASAQAQRLRGFLPADSCPSVASLRVSPAEGGLWSSVPGPSVPCAHTLFSPVLIPCGVTGGPLVGRARPKCSLPP